MRGPVETRLPRDVTCAAIARRCVERQLTEVLTKSALDDVKLVVSELVDNAYRHGRGQIKLSLACEAGKVRVEVVDEGEGQAIAIRERGPDDFGGHGLRLVDEISAAWGAYEGTTHVWADLPRR
jgi:anti-sigma regulatory factor (Ser/Thr protein kinase)